VNGEISRDFGETYSFGTNSFQVCQELVSKRKSGMKTIITSNTSEIGDEGENGTIGEACDEFSWSSLDRRLTLPRLGGDGRVHVSQFRD
jgi:hypothetical protein